jgi:hypothetical protein
MSDATLCVRPPANIGPRGQRHRLTIGVVGLAVAGFLAYQLHDPNVGRAWRLAVGVPLFLGCMGLIQAREKT